MSTISTARPFGAVKTAIYILLVGVPCDGFSSHSSASTCLFDVTNNTLAHRSKTLTQKDKVLNCFFHFVAFLKIKLNNGNKNRIFATKGKHPFRPLGMTKPLLLLTRRQECLTVVVLANLFELIGEEFFVEPLLVLLP